jgi:uncharacterized phage-like protein YoqJ
MIQKAPTFVLITGHRPQKLGGFGHNPIASRVRQHLRDTLTALQTRISTLHGVTGMALGCDQWFADLCLSLQIRYTAFLPFQGQERLWPMSSQLQYRRLLAQAAAVQCPLLQAATLSPHDIRQALLRRNTAMVEQSHAAIAIWDGSPSGTGDAVRKLDAANIPTFRMHPHVELNRQALDAWLDDVQARTLHL